MIAPAYESTEGSSLCLLFAHLSGDKVERIVGVSKNLAESGRRIDLGPWLVATLEVTWNQTEFVADSG
jgi:hypothetical protein